MITTERWIQRITFAAETNAMRLQWRLGEQRGANSSGGVSSRGAADRQTGRHADTEHHNTFFGHLSGGEGNTTKYIVIVVCRSS